MKYNHKVKIGVKHSGIEKFFRTAPIVVAIIKIKILHIFLL